MTATQEEETILEKHWKADLATGPGGLFTGTITTGQPFVYKLEGSQLSHEIALNDEDGVRIRFMLKEHDGTVKDIFGGAWDWIKDVADGIEFDTSTIAGPNKGHHPAEYTGSITFRREYNLDDGRVVVVLNIEMNLIIPLDRPDIPKVKR